MAPSGGSGTFLILTGGFSIITFVSSTLVVSIFFTTEEQK